MRLFNRRALSAIASAPSVLDLLAAHEVGGDGGGGGGGGGGGMDGPLLVVLVVVVETEVELEVGVGWHYLKSLHHPPLLPGPV